jgi:type VI secretion system protein ImpL
MLSLNWILILLGIIILVLCILVVLYIVLRKARKKSAPQEVMVETGALVEIKKGEVAPIEFIQYDSSSSLGLRASFSKAMRVLKAHVAGRDYRYRLPWFLMIGESRSGKTTLLGNTGLNLSIGPPTEHVRGIKQGLNWCIFDKGVVLDVSGDYVLHPDGETSNSKGWNTISRLLQKHRPQRPLDGVVLTIPCTDLIGAKNLSVDHRIKLEQKAALLYKKLWQAQKVLGMSFPVYILITKCDQIAGFQSLCHEVPPHLQNDIFGWSSPYTLETAYKSEWVDEAFRSLHGYLFQIQVEVFAERANVQDKDGLFLLPSEMQSMRAPLQVYLDHLFKESSFHDSFFFRGLYFCGDGNVSDAPAPAIVRSEAEPPIEWGVPAQELYEPLPAIPSEVAIRKPVFLKHLFEKKIFQEDLLAKPVVKTMLSRNRMVLASQILSLAIPLIGVIGILATYSGLQTREKEIHELLMREAQDLNELRARYGRINQPAEQQFSRMDEPQGTGENKLIAVSYIPQVADNERTFEEGATSPVASETRDEEEHLLSAMTKIARKKFYSVFIPSSWFSGLNQRIAESLIASYRYTVLESLRLDLESRTNDLLAGVSISDQPLSADPVEKTDQMYEHAVDLAHPRSNSVQPPPPVAAPRVLTTDFELRKFIEELGGLLVNRSRYDRLRKKDGGSIEELSKLGAYLGHARLPDDFDEGNEIFQQALAKEGRPLQSNDVYTQGQQKVTEMIEGIYEVSFERDVVTYDYLHEIGQAETVLTRPAYTWLSTYVFDDPHSAFYEMTVLKSLRELRKALVGLRKERFMSKDPSLRPSARLLVRRQLVWNREPLQRAIALYQEYASFVDGKPYSSDGLDNSVKQAAITELKSKITSLVAQAQEYHPVESLSGESFLRTSIATEIKSFEEAQDLLTQLMDISDKLGMNLGLRQALARQAFYLLRAINGEFNSSSFYTMTQDNFAWWDGKRSPSFTAFGVSGPDELATYLSLQRKRIAYLGELAAPIFTFLSAQNIAPPESLKDWNEVLTELDNYNSKKPGNSVAALENFIRYEMDTVNVDDCFKLTRQSAASSGDFFLNRRNYLRRLLVGRCNQLAREKTESDDFKALADYREIEKAFNDKLTGLAGRFPFADISDNQPLAEADIESIVAFFKLLAKKGPSAREALERIANDRGAQEAGLEFMRQMDEVRVFFGDFLERKQQFPVFDFDVQLRVNQAEEKGANQIIDWNLDVGKKRFRLLDEDHTGRWLFGQPIHLSLRWANDSPTAPVSATTSPQVRVKDRTANLEYSSRWSLLEFIMRHRGDLLLHRGDPAPDSVEYVDVNPYTLKFTIPTRIAALTPPLEQVQREDLRTEQAEVYMRVSLLAPNKKDLLQLPSKFPTKAPRLPLGNIKLTPKQ